MKRNHNTADKVRVFERSCVLCFRYVTQEHQEKVLHHIWVPLVLVVALHLSNILFVYFSVFITHCSELRREEVDVGVEKVQLQ